MRVSSLEGPYNLALVCPLKQRQTKRSELILHFLAKVDATLVSWNGQTFTGGFLRLLVLIDAAQWGARAVSTVAIYAIANKSSSATHASIVHNMVDVN